MLIGEATTVGIMPGLLTIAGSAGPDSNQTLGVSRAL